MEILQVLSLDKELLEILMSDIKGFLRVDFEYDDNLIFSLIVTAEGYLKNAGCIVDYNNFLFVLAIKLLVVHWYDNREVIAIAGSKPAYSNNLSYSLESIITQLKYSYGDDII